VTAAAAAVASREVAETAAPASEPVEAAPQEPPAEAVAPVEPAAEDAPAAAPVAVEQQQQEPEPTPTEQQQQPEPESIPEQQQQQPATMAAADPLAPDAELPPVPTYKAWADPLTKSEAFDQLEALMKVGSLRGCKLGVLAGGLAGF